MDIAVKSEILQLIEKVKTLVISAMDKDGTPITKGVTKLGHDDLAALYFCTSKNSAFYQWFLQNAKTSVYMFDDDPNTAYPSVDEKYFSLSLIGKMEAVCDHETKERFFSDYLAMFYPGGIDDENYNLMRFSIQSGKYYRGITDNSLSLDFENLHDV